MTRPRLTLREAATATGTSYSTLRRRREAGDFPGATKDVARGWLVPVEDLLAAGLKLNAPAPPDAPADSASTIQASADVDVAQLRADLAAAKTEAKMLREMLAEKDRSAAQAAALLEANLGDLRRQVLMLTSGQPGQPAQPGGQPAFVPEQPSGQPGDGPSAAQRLRRWARGTARHRRQ